jgi:hypothetical protein
VHCTVHATRGTTLAFLIPQRLPLSCLLCIQRCEAPVQLVLSTACSSLVHACQCAADQATSYCSGAHARTVSFVATGVCTCRAMQLPAVGISGLGRSAAVYNPCSECTPATRSGAAARLRARPTTHPYLHVFPQFDGLLLHLQLPATRGGGLFPFALQLPLLLLICSLFFSCGAGPIRSARYTTGQERPSHRRTFYVILLLACFRRPIVLLRHCVQSTGAACPRDERTAQRPAVKPDVLGA